MRTNSKTFDEFDDRFEDDEVWLDDFDDRDAKFDEGAEMTLLDNSGIDFDSLDGPKRPDVGILLGGEGEDDEHDDEIAA